MRYVVYCRVIVLFGLQSKATTKEQMLPVMAACRQLCVLCFTRVSHSALHLKLLWAAAGVSQNMFCGIKHFGQAWILLEVYWVALNTVELVCCLEHSDQLSCELVVDLSATLPCFER